MWQPIETAPKDQFLLLCGPSEYTITPMVVTTGCMYSDYHAGRWIDHANDDLTDWGFEPTHWAPLILPDAQPAPSDEYVGWYCAHCERGVDASEVTYHEQHQVCGRVITDDRPPKPAPSIPEGWKPIPEKHPTFDLVDLRLADGSVLCECVPQSDGDYWWNGPSGEVFINPKYAPATHWRLAAAPEAKP